MASVSNLSRTWGRDSRQPHLPTLPVQTVKNLLKKTSDPYKARMAYRATPLESGLSRAELHQNPYLTK